MPPPRVDLIAPDDSGIPALLDRLSPTSAQSVFLSRPWLEACLATWPASAGHRLAAIALDDARPAQTPPGDAPVALALLGARTLRRHGWLTVRALGLNEALDDDLDEPTLELNGLYGAPDPAFETGFGRLLDWLDTRTDWDELHVSAVASGRARIVGEKAAEHGLWVRSAKDVQTWWTDLERVRTAHAGDYLAALSSNTRQQIRRAHRALAKDLGEPVLEQADTVPQMLEWLDALAVAHRERWSTPGRRSGFDLPSFRAFHRTLIERMAPPGGVQMLRVRAGAHVFAYLYNLVLDGHVYFLMSGIEYGALDRHKPGMLAHRLAIEHNLALGMRVYDFLGGSQRYKASLGTDHDTQHWLVLSRPRIALRVEHALRRLRRRLRAYAARGEREGSSDRDGPGDRVGPSDRNGPRDGGDRRDRNGQGRPIEP